MDQIPLGTKAHESGVNCEKFRRYRIFPAGKIRAPGKIAGFPEIGNEHQGLFMHI
jgi:hypothetical protein